MILGTKVTVNHKKNNKGRIEIEYYSNEELERIMDLSGVYSPGSLTGRTEEKGDNKWKAVFLMQSVSTRGSSLLFVLGVLTDRLGLYDKDLHENEPFYKKV